MKNAHLKTQPNAAPLPLDTPAFHNESTQRSSSRANASRAPGLEKNRQQIIAEAAYDHAERRGSESGDMTEEGLNAEAEIGRLLEKLKSL